MQQYSLTSETTRGFKDDQDGQLFSVIVANDSAVVNAFAEALPAFYLKTI